MARKRSSPVEEIVELVSKLPWWVGLALALISFLILHAFASRPPPITGPGQLGVAATGGLIRVLAMFGQIVLPFAFVLGSLISAFNTAKDKKAFDAVTKRTGGPSGWNERKPAKDSSNLDTNIVNGIAKPLSADFSFRHQVANGWTSEILGALEWKRFETVCAEYFRLTGYDAKETRIGADGGVDIWVYKQGTERPFGIVQCKAWHTYKVGVKPVRELYGVMSAESVADGMFVTSGEFTTEAVAFAEGKRIRLISGEKFLAKIKQLSEEKKTALLTIALEGDYRTPTCPQCGFKMMLRQGEGKKNSFWGCVKYPKCKATLGRAIGSGLQAFKTE